MPQHEEHSDFCFLTHLHMYNNYIELKLSPEYFQLLDIKCHKPITLHGFNLHMDIPNYPVNQHLMSLEADCQGKKTYVMLINQFSDTLDEKTLFKIPQSVH